MLPCLALIVPSAQAAQLSATTQNRAVKKVMVEADSINESSSMIRARGNVMACFAEYTLHSDLLEYDRHGKTINSPGHFYIKSPQHTIDGSAFVYNMSTRQGEIREVNLLFGENGLHAFSDVARVLPASDWAEDKTDAANRPPLQMIAENVSISSCKSDSRDWVLEAKTLHYQDNVARAEDIVFRFYGVPVMYSPVYVIDNDPEKHSGFLLPDSEIGNNGFSAKIPYYIYLAENYDATITPRWYSKHGLLVEGEVRYLFGAHEGIFVGGWTALEKESRQSGKFRHHWRIPHWQLKIVTEDISDSLYYADFSDDSDEIARRNLPRRAALHYQNGNWEAAVIGEKLKTIYTGPPPHNRLPQTYVRYWGGNGTTSVFSEWEYTNFSANRIGQDESERYLWRGELARRWSIGGLTLRPQTGFHAVKYGGNDARFVVPYIHILAETGYRPMPSGWGDYHLRGMAAYAPHAKQDKAPVFDTALRELQSGGIYSWNRFVGGDRAADAQVAAYGAEWRLWDSENKREQFSLEVAQRFYLRRPRVTLPFERDLPARGFANLLGAMKVRPQEWWRLEAKTEWNPASKKWISTYADVRVDFGHRRHLRLGGLFEEENSLLLGGALPLWARADMSFVLRYLGEEDRLAESAVALQIRNECDCWRLNLGAKNIITVRNETQKSYFIGMEFKGLGVLGSNQYEQIVRELR